MGLVLSEKIVIKKKKRLSSSLCHIFSLPRVGNRNYVESSLVKLKNWAHLNTFSTRVHPAMPMESNDPLYSNCKEEAPLRLLFPYNYYFCGTNSCMNASLNTILNFSGQESFVIYPPYLNNFHFLLSPLSFLSNTSIITTILIVTIYFGWLLSFVLDEIYYKINGLNPQYFKEVV